MSAGSWDGSSETDILSASLRARLIELADQLIPANHQMPAASEAGVADVQLTVVLEARPDLVDPLRRVLSLAGGELPALEFLNALQSSDPEGHEALVLALVGGYYTSPRVVQLLGYPGQNAAVVTPDIYPPYVEEGLLESLMERGSLFRQASD